LEDDIKILISQCVPVVPPQLCYVKRKLLHSSRSTFQSLLKPWAHLLLITMLAKQLSRHQAPNRVQFTDHEFQSSNS